MAGGERAWKCLVCGYVHRGPAAPDECPVCGAAADEFEVFEAAAPAPRHWRCLDCGTIHEGPAPPDECPVCGAAADSFEPMEQAAPRPARGVRVGRLVVVGAGAAGVAAAEAAREAAPEAEILLLSSEAHLPYYRINLTRYLAGEVDEDALCLYREEWYRDRRIGLRLGAEVESFSPAEHTVTLQGGEVERFDRLVLASGASPFSPPMPGAATDGVMALRSLDDARRILDAAQPGARCVCIGGGILGLESAGALARRGVEVVLLERSEWLMRRQLNREAAALLERHTAGLGIRVMQDARVSEIVGGARVQGVRLEEGGTLPADLVLVTAGVRSNVAPARAAGLEVGQGVLVDDTLATSHPDVFAAGDVAEHRKVLYGTWEPARFQGNIAGRNAAGEQVEFGGMPRAHTLKVLGLGLFSIGQIDADADTLEIAEERDGSYARFLFRGGVLAGAILLGDTSAATAVRKAVELGTDFSGLLTGRLSPTAILARLAS